MKVKVKFMMEDLRIYEANYNLDDTLPENMMEFAAELTKRRRLFPFIMGYEIEMIKEEVI